MCKGGFRVGGRRSASTCWQKAILCYDDFFRELFCVVGKSVFWGFWFHGFAKVNPESESQSRWKAVCPCLPSECMLLCIYWCKVFPNKFAFLSLHCWLINEMIVRFPDRFLPPPPLPLPLPHEWVLFLFALATFSMFEFVNFCMYYLSSTRIGSWILKRSWEIIIFEGQLFE